MSKPKAVVLLSGGLDSTTTLAIARDQGFDCAALSFAYGQRHHAELEAARLVAAHYKVANHVVVEVDMRLWGGSALTSEIAVPKGRSEEAMGESIPVTYVPARNTIFLAFALSYAEAIGATDIYIGVNALDYSGYPDCRPAFIAAFEALAKVATKAGVEGHPVTMRAPLIDQTKAQIITRGRNLGVPYELTHSCYDPVLLPVALDRDGVLMYGACGECDSCILRAKGFAEAHVPDPTRYASNVIATAPAE